MFTYDGDTIAAMSPAVRIEIQTRIVDLDRRAREFRASGRPDRRRPRHVPHHWPQSQPWTARENAALRVR